MRIIILAAIAAAATLASMPADARPNRNAAPASRAAAASDAGDQHVLMAAPAPVAHQRGALGRGEAIQRVRGSRAMAHAPGAGSQSMPHPAGCPRVAFCGCGVSVRVFGRSVRSLWLAAAWRRFPRTSPGPGAVAVFGSRHVAYIVAYHGDGMALVYDPNSGHHQTRIHMRRIAGATIVMPRG